MRTNFNEMTINFEKSLYLPKFKAVSYCINPKDNKNVIDDK